MIATTSSMRLISARQRRRVQRRGADDKVRTRQPEEMSPYARRLVHLAVAEDAALASASLGDSFLKVIVISKK
jgi:predicted RNA-binding protein Jag